MKAKEITIFGAGEKQTFLFPVEDDILEFINSVLMYCFNAYKGTDNEFVLQSIVCGFETNISDLKGYQFITRLKPHSIKKTYYFQIGDQKIFEVVEKD